MNKLPLPRNVVTNEGAVPPQTGLETAGNAQDNTLPNAPPGWELLDSYGRNILCLTAQGLTNAQIGEKLFKSEKTIINRKTEIIAQLGLNTEAWHILTNYVTTHQVFLRQQPFLQTKK